MSAVSEQHLQELAARVARRIASEREECASPASGFAMLVLSGSGSGLDRALSVLAKANEPIVAVADCPAGSAGAVGAAMAILPGLRVQAGETSFEADRMLAGVTRVLAPSIDLALAARIAGLQADTPGARVVLRALLKGVPVRASVDDREFAVSAEAPTGTKRAVAHVLDRLRDLGVALEGETSSPAAPAAALVQSAAYGAGREHPSQDRFPVAEPLNEFIEYLESRPCMIEQGKPCVDCGACETRGF